MGDPVTHWQIVSTNPEMTSRFYGKLFNWQIGTSNSLGYRVVETNSAKGIGGGIWPAPTTATSLVQLFIEVEDVDALVQKALTLGATLLVPVAALPDGDVIAVVQDPVGLPFGIMQRRK